MSRRILCIRVHVAVIAAAEAGYAQKPGRISAGMFSMVLHVYYFNFTPPQKYARQYTAVMSLLDAFFVDPGCAYDVFLEDNEAKWLECATSRSKSSLVIACIIAAVMVLICMIFAPLNATLIVLAVCAVVLGVMFYGHVNTEYDARAQFLNSRRALADAGFDPTASYSPQERAEKRAAAMERIRQDQLRVQGINAVSNVGAALFGSLTGARVRNANTFSGFSNAVTY